MDTLSDSQRNERLWDAASRGDTSAVWEIAEGLRPYLKAVVQKLLPDRLNGKADGSDVVQQGLAHAVEHLREFRGKSQEELQAWLVAIVSNEARKAVRYWNQARRDVKREVPLELGSGEGRDFEDLGSTPRTRALRRERAAAVMLAISRLPADYQQVIRLRSFQGLSHAEIAAGMGRSPAAVRQLWGRAIVRLRQELDDCV